MDEQEPRRRTTRGGRERVPIAERLIWAPVMRPTAPILYLDLNHFVYLARVLAGDAKTPTGYTELYEAAMTAVADGRVVIPLSGDHLFEMYAIKDPAQRHALADVMERLSALQYLLGRVSIAELEFRAGIDAIVGSHRDEEHLPLIGQGFGRAFGMVGGIKVVAADGSDASGEVDPEGLSSINREFERSMLRGPSDEEARALRGQAAYDPDVAQESHRSRLAFEVELGQHLEREPRWRRGRLRDVVSAREVVHERLDIINREQEARALSGREQLDVQDDRAFLQLVAAMPHSQVAIAIKTQYHRDGKHQWTTNDITDIDAMSVAFAYCDAVFTDKAIRSALASSRELRGFGTVMPRRPTDLVEWLNQLTKPPLADLLVPHPHPRPCWPREGDSSS